MVRGKIKKHNCNQKWRNNDRDSYNLVIISSIFPSPFTRST